MARNPATGISASTMMRVRTEHDASTRFSKLDESAGANGDDSFFRLKRMELVGFAVAKTALRHRRNKSAKTLIL